MEQKVLEFKSFYGVYLLCSQSEIAKYKNKCYVGFTVNPNRRINQHNKGNAFGGAKKTSDRGPWSVFHYFEHIFTKIKIFLLVT